MLDMHISRTNNSTARKQTEFIWQSVLILSLFKVKLVDGAWLQYGMKWYFNFR